NSEMQQGGINGMAERAVDKGGGVKGLSPEAMRAQRTPLRPPPLSTTLSQGEASRCPDLRRRVDRLAPGLAANLSRRPGLRPEVEHMRNAVDKVKVVAR